MENHNLMITNQLGTKLHEARLLKTICLWNFKNIDRRNGNVPRSVEAIAGAVYGQQLQDNDPSTGENNLKNSLDDGTIGNILLLMQ